MKSDLYSLIMSSKLPSAKKFKHWGTSDVLPSIHKPATIRAPGAATIGNPRFIYAPKGSSLPGCVGSLLQRVFIFVCGGCRQAVANHF